MGGSCKGCKYSGKRHSGPQVNCNLNECIYADALYDIRKACELIADIFKRYDDECFKAAGVKIINKITEKIQTREKEKKQK